MAMAIPVVANAKPWTDGERDHRHMQPVSAKMFGSEHCNNEGGMGHLPSGLDLSESQQDKIFSILNAQAQPLYEQEKIVRNAYIDLHKMATSEQYADGKAAAISESLAKAKAKIVLIHAQEEHQIYALLTDEQRKLLNAQKAMLSRGKPDRFMPDRM